MKKSNYYLKGIISAVLPFLTFYLVTSFINVSFDIRDWGETERIFVGVFGCFAGISVVAFYVINQDVK